MKMRVDMMVVHNMMDTLEKQNTEKSKELLTALKQMFAPLLNECQGFIVDPTFDVDVDTMDGEAEPDIDWEQRRYEIAKEVAVAEVNAFEVLKKGIDGAGMKEAIAKRSVKMADTLIDELKRR